MQGGLLRAKRREEASWRGPREGHEGEGGARRGTGVEDGADAGEPRAGGDAPGGGFAIDAAEGEYGGAGGDARARSDGGGEGREAEGLTHAALGGGRKDRAEGDEVGAFLDGARGLFGGVRGDAEEQRWGEAAVRIDFNNAPMVASVLDPVLQQKITQLPWFHNRRKNSYSVLGPASSPGQQTMTLAASPPIHRQDHNLDLGWCGRYSLLRH